MEQAMDWGERQGGEKHEAHVPSLSQNFVSVDRKTVPLMQDRFGAGPSPLK